MQTNSYVRVICAVALIAMTSVIAFSQAQTVKPSVASGEVVSIEPGKIVLRTKDGSLDVVLSDKTEYKRVPPDNPSLKAAVATSFGDIAAGDKLIVSGIMSDDKKTLPARSVYLMTKADIAQRQTSEAERWAAGIKGRVASVDPTTGQIKIEIRGLMNSTTVVVSAKPEAKFKRYANNSVKFSDAKLSSLSEIQPGDGLQARGERSADGASFTADEIISGGFRTIGGAVKAVDAAKNQVIITEDQSKKDITVDLTAAVFMKKVPEEMAQRMAAFQGGQGGMRPAGGAPAGGGAPANRPAGGMGGPGGARGGFEEMLEKFPNISASDLKVGETIAIVTSKNGGTDHMTAFKLLAGIEPLIQLARVRAAANGGGQRGGQGTLSLDIPGLDGFSGP